MVRVRNRELRAEAVRRLQDGAPLSQQDIDLIAVMPTQRTALQAYLARLAPKNEIVVHADDSPLAGLVLPGTPSTNDVTVSFKADKYKLSDWITGLSDDVIELLQQEVVEPPDATFSHRTVQRMAMQGSSDKTIARLLGIETKALRLEAHDALELGRTVYIFLLEHRQFTGGMAGDRSMLVWLGKQKLGQSDKIAVDATVHDGGPAEKARSVSAVREKLMRRRDEIRAGDFAVVSSVPLLSPGE